MKRGIAIFFAALISFGTLAANEPDKRTPIERYRGDGQFSLMMCKITLKLALLRSEAGSQQDEKSDYSGCISDGEAKAKANLTTALKAVKKAKAQEALKSYHVTYIAALKGIRPGVDERKISYEQRQQALEDKLTEAWARFEVEQ